MKPPVRLLLFFCIVLPAGGAVRAAELVPAPADAAADADADPAAEKEAPGEASPGAPDAPVAKGASVLVRLDATESVDPDGDALTYRWTQIEGPEVALSDPAAATPHFRTRLPGVYRFSLVVSDGADWSDPAVVTVRVQRPNSPPEAVAPLGLETRVGVPVVLDGSESRDADADAITHHWRQTAGPPLFLGDEATRSAKLKVTPDKPGIYEFELIVRDGTDASRPARTRLTVHPPNRTPRAAATAPEAVSLEPTAGRVAQDAPRDAPVALAPAEVVVGRGERVVLDAARSYSPRGRELRYYWQQRGGPFVEAYDRPEGAESRIAFTPPELGTYVFSLIVSDGEHESAPRRVRVRVVEGNAAPVAQIRAPRRAHVGATIELDGGRSYDRENETIAYRWRQVAGPRVLEAGLAGRHDPSKAVFTPHEPGAYVFELVVSDGEHESEPARAAVLVQKGNRAPKVESVDRIACAPGESFTLLARGEDPEGAPLRYAWRQVDGPTLLEEDAPQREVELTPREAGVYRFEATAHDGQTASAPARCEVTVAAPNDPPMAVTKGLVLAWVGEPVTLDARASTDPEGDELSFAWRVAEKHDTETYRLLEAETAEAFFTPHRKGEYEIVLEVRDERAAGEPMRVTVRARDRGGLSPVALGAEE